MQTAALILSYVIYAYLAKCTVCFIHMIKSYAVVPYAWVQVINIYLVFNWPCLYCKQMVSVCVKMPPSIVTTVNYSNVPLYLYTYYSEVCLLLVHNQTSQGWL